MKSPTSQYAKLKKDLGGIRGLLRGVPDTSNNTNLQHLKVQSYVFLAHAAFEEYLEGLSRAIVEASIEQMNKKGEVNACIVSLITFETVAQVDKDIPRREISAKVVRRLRDFVHIAKSNQLGIVNANNGVKLKDQRNLLLPIGLDPEEVDSFTANALDAFGVKRGGVAHRVKIQTEETKSTVLKDTHTIFEGLRNFDEAACDIINRRLIVPSL